MDNYVQLHCHTELSNATTVLDSVNSYKQYIEQAVEYNMKSIAFTEHGNVMSWYNKVKECKKNGIKPIHGCEVYVTKTLDEKIRDNYHCILLSKNTEGLHELNNLMSDKVAFNSEDNHMYYNPRISYEELKNTSDNLIILTACLGGILNSEDEGLKEDFIDFLTKNKHRCYLEIQPHQDSEKLQFEYNKYLYNLSKKHGLELVATNDVHYINQEYKIGRSLLQKRKSVRFATEDDWDSEFKDYKNFLDAFLKQNSLPKEVILKAIDNTNTIADQISEYEIDTSIKYPKLYENSEDIFKQKISEGIKSRGIDIDKYRDRINHEYKTIKNNGAIDYMLLEEDVKRWCRKNKIRYGASRGSASGSVIAFLLGITDVDSLKYDLNFERFMSPERVSLCDIDSDYEPSKRDLVKEYLHNMDGVYCAEIITFNTIQKKGALKDVGGALGIPFSEMNEITKNIDDEDLEIKYRKKYPKLFKYAEMLEGVVVSVGSHPAGTIISPIPLEDSVGTFRSKTCDYPITQLNMKEVDSMNFTKLDVLGLETVEIINDVCEMVGIDYLTPQNFDPEDPNIYKEIHKSGVSIFQWESGTAWKYYKKLFSKDTIDQIKHKNNDFKYLDLFSIGNGAIRPAGDSYREELAEGIYKDNGAEVINEYFKPTLGNCVYQESIMGFLNKFCGFSMGEADVVRRGFAKKTGTEEFIPKIKDGFLKHSGLSQEEGEKAINIFIQVVEDASDYLFSLNHSQIYSIIGAMTAYLRHYYPLEFLTVCLEHAKKDQTKTEELIKFMKDHTNFTLKEIEFGKSKAKYSCDKSLGVIYKGMSSIKKINAKIPDELNSLKSKNFIELMDDIKNHTSCNSGQIEVLIKVGYFNRFGKSRKLLKFYEWYQIISKKKTFSKSDIDPKLEKYLTFGATYDTIIKEKRIKNELVTKEMDVIKSSAKTTLIKYTEESRNLPNCTETEKLYKNLDKDNILKIIWNDIPDDDFQFIPRIQAQLEYMGYISEEIKEGQVVLFVKWSGTSKAGNKGAWMRSLRNGREGWFKFTKDLKLPPQDSIIYVYDVDVKKFKNDSGEVIESYKIKEYNIIKEA